MSKASGFRTSVDHREATGYNGQLEMWQLLCCPPYTTKRHTRGVCCFRYRPSNLLEQSPLTITYVQLILKPLKCSCFKLKCVRVWNSIFIPSMLHFIRFDNSFLLRDRKGWMFDVFNIFFLHLFRSTFVFKQKSQRVRRYIFFF